MKPSSAELRCIAYSRALREKIMHHEIHYGSGAPPPLLLTPRRFHNYLWKDRFDFEHPLHQDASKKYQFWILMVVLTLWLWPVVLIFRLFQIARGDRNNRDRIRKIKEKYSIDDEAPETKSFALFWETKGIKNWGLSNFSLKAITERDQYDCLRFWFMTLYGLEEQHLNDLEQSIREDNEARARAFYRRHPDGHCSRTPPLMLLPESIDNVFGPYA